MQTRSLNSWAAAPKRRISSPNTTRSNHAISAACAGSSRRTYWTLLKTLKEKQMNNHTNKRTKKKTRTSKRDVSKQPKTVRTKKKQAAAVRTEKKGKKKQASKQIKANQSLQDNQKTCCEVPFRSNTRSDHGADQSGPAHRHPTGLRS